MLEPWGILCSLASFFQDVQTADLVYQGGGLWGWVLTRRGVTVLRSGGEWRQGVWVRLEE